MIVTPLARSLWSLEATTANPSDAFVFWLAIAHTLDSIFEKKEKDIGITPKLALHVRAIFNTRYSQFFKHNEVYFVAFCLDPPIRDFFDKRSKGNTDNAMFSIGVALFPVRVDDKERETPVGKETGRRYASLHANLILIIHPQKSGAPGKAIAVGEPNVIKLYSDLHPADSGDILEGRMNALLRAAFSRQKTSRKWIWINKPRPERNDNGDCVELVLYWIMEMICNGVEIERSGGKVIGIKNFRKVPLRK
ncbi:hypothetical protein B0H10DRAFT_2228962 [Mycena sp. CBHHK59/15]|nr:hypothetical protein B0H10DRAFT_2228962 [Mycena sp. CBHHK59/15]